MAIQKITKNVLNAELQDLSNVDSTALGAGEDGYVVSWDNANTQFTYTALTLNTNTDVTITSPTSGQVLKYNGSSWVNDVGSGVSSGKAIAMALVFG